MSPPGPVVVCALCFGERIDWILHFSLSSPQLPAGTGQPCPASLLNAQMDTKGGGESYGREGT
jgi:hypothetical protein